MTTGAAVRSSHRGTRVTAIALAAVMVLLLAALVVQAAVSGQLTAGNTLSNSGVLLTMATIAAVGLVVAWHQPANPTGWLLLAVSLCFTFGFNAGSYIALRYRLGHTSLPLGPLALLLTSLFLLAIPLFALVIMLFPDGRLPSRGWKWFTGVCLALAVAGPVCFEIATASIIMGRHIRVLRDGQLTGIQYPAGGTAWLAVVEPVFFAAIAALWLGSLARQVLSWRRSAGERRQQLKWLLAGAVVFAALGVPSLGVTSSLWKVMTLGFAALPVAIGIGILKFGLYEIDRIISRTLAYAIVTGLLVGVYTGLVLLGTRVLPFSSPVAIAASTLTAAALFSPLRRRVQQGVDRRFNRARYDAQRTVGAFATRLQDTADPDMAQADLLDTVTRALEPAHISLWITPAGPR